MDAIGAFVIIRELVEKFIDSDRSELTTYDKRKVEEVLDAVENIIQIDC